jgi:protein-serine/threonine kinase
MLTVSALDFVTIGPAEDTKPKSLVQERGLQGALSPKHFRKVRILGKGAVGRVYLVQYRETGAYYAMKVLSKREMIEKNKVCLSSPAIVF